MPIDRLGPNQVINRQARINTLLFGAIDAITLGEITNAISTTQLPTGQQRATGQPQPVDVAGSIMFADSVSIARVQAWKALNDQGAEGAVQKGVSFQYYLEDGSPGPLVVAEEVFVHTIVYPATDLAATGDASQVTFTMSVFNANLLPGTA